MTNFAIHFSYPWLFFLLIPGLFLTFFPYFRLAKKYRRTRNRVISVVLHTIVLVLLVTALTGVSFSYEVANRENEVLLLVDVSDSSVNAEAKRNETVKNIIDESTSRFKVGVVTFGYTQVYASPFSYDKSAVYSKYLRANLPDTSATDISSALAYAKDLIETPESAKIVLISDGLETDGKAANAVRSVAAEGIEVDTVLISYESTPDVQIIGIEYPDENLVTGYAYDIGVSVQSAFAGSATITLYDRNSVTGAVESVTQSVTLMQGTQTIPIKHAFSLPYLHTISATIESSGDTLAANNQFYSYVYLLVHDRVLIIERNDNESDALKEILIETYPNLNVVNIFDEDAMPATVNDLRAYDEIILVNIANADMPSGFDDILHSYVYDYGGGLFTVGGSRMEGALEVPNAYNRLDMYGTLYQEMLPVQAIDYTPPVAVMMVIDRSGSMIGKDAETGQTILDLAKQGALDCLRLLSERDYCGVMSLESDYSEEISITPVTQQSKIIEAINAIEAGGGTVFSPALTQAGSILSTVQNVERKHIILVTDGAPSDSYEEYSAVIKRNYDAFGITCSIVGINITASNAVNMSNAVSGEDASGAKYNYGAFHNVTEVNKLSSVMRDDITSKAIAEIEYKTFQPTIKSFTSVMSGITQAQIPTLDGYYGTKAKDNATVVLSGEYVPIYAQWKYGAGTVGSFMCDLSGRWSKEFLSDDKGQQIIRQIISALAPTVDITPTDIRAELIENNYTTQINIYTRLAETETLEVEVTHPSADGGTQTQIFTATAREGYTRFSYISTVPGLHTVVIRKKNAEGTVLDTYTAYRAFSYSEEYDTFRDPEEGALLLAELASGGNGAVINEAWEIYEEYVKYVHKSFDPRLIFIITSIVLFLLDIAVRKFKFKWIHEIVRERKEKQLAEKK